MTVKTFAWIRLAIIIAAGAAGGIGGALHIPIVILAAVPLAIVVLLVLGRRVTDRVNDERLNRLANSAARWSYAVFAVAAGVAAGVFVTIDRPNGPLWTAGMILTGAIAFQALAFSAFYFIFTRRH